MVRVCVCAFAWMVSQDLGDTGLVWFKVSRFYIYKILGFERVWVSKYGFTYKIEKMKMRAI